MSYFFNPVHLKLTSNQPAGFDGLKIQRTEQSFLSLGDPVHDLPPGSLLVLNHDERKIFDAFENTGGSMSESDVAGKNEDWDFFLIPTLFIHSNQFHSIENSMLLDEDLRTLKLKIKKEFEEMQSQFQRFFIDIEWLNEQNKQFHIQLLFIAFHSTQYIMNQSVAGIQMDSDDNAKK
ncbi:hypothetical protein RJT34_31941 [Clitoria ternatea]|uniref:Ankyrin repeat domain-containing protein n=1 Tax=Clitoria ternatea TaxID=43366 RepID=A0AAN9EWG7_CLITE